MIRNTTYSKILTNMFKHNSIFRAFIVVVKFQFDVLRSQKMDIKIYKKAFLIFLYSFQGIFLYISIGIMQQIKVVTLLII